MPSIILASQSPRRQELLSNLGIKFITDPSNFSEKPHTGEPPEQLALHNATGKAKDVAQRHPNSIIIGVDTIGHFQGQILEKPVDRQDAHRLISIISGTTHEVISGITVIKTDSNAAPTQTLTATVTTEVEMISLTNDEIETYLDTEQWQDKAAAYAIQNQGALFIKSINGDYFNIVGLPLFQLNQMLKTLGHNLLLPSLPQND